MNGSLSARISAILLAGCALLVLALPASAKQAATSVPGQAVTTQSTAATQDFLLVVGDMIEISILENGAYLQPSDARFVDRLSQYYIYPKAQRPGSYRLERDTNLANALTIGKGLTARGTQRDERLKRNDSTGKVAQLRPGIVDSVLSKDVVFVRDSIY